MTARTMDAALTSLPLSVARCLPLLAWQHETERVVLAVLAAGLISDGDLRADVGLWAYKYGVPTAVMIGAIARGGETTAGAMWCAGPRVLEAREADE